jgi:hypothetical protein
VPTAVTPMYLDWQFWAAIVAAIALVLSQLPPVHLWFRPRRLEVEVHSRIQITHKVGNPNVSMYVAVRNTGGRELRIRSMRLDLSRDGTAVGIYAAQNYFEQPSSQQTVLMVPFTLKPGETWGHTTNFLNLFDRATEKLFRSSESALGVDIKTKLANRPQGNSMRVEAEPELVAPFLALFNRLFIWEPGEYVATLIVDADPGSASFSQKYRFTLFESDSADLRAQLDDYKYGGGLLYNVEQHVGISVPLSQ